MDANKEAAPLPPINYEPMVTLYSQWRSKTGTRSFVIVRLHYDFPDDKCKDVAKPVSLEVLDLKTDFPFAISWASFIKLVETGEMVKILINQ